VTLDTQIRRLVLALIDVTGQAEGTLVLQGAIINRSSGVAARGRTPGQVAMYLRRMRLGRGFLVAGRAISTDLMVILVAAGAIRLDAQGRPTGMAVRAGDVPVDAVIEGQRTDALCAREVEGDRPPQRFGGDLTHGVAPLTLFIRDVHVVAVGAPRTIRRRRRKAVAMALRAFVLPVKVVSESTGILRLPGGVPGGERGGHESEEHATETCGGRAFHATGTAAPMSGTASR
jgi:hypothetical protein